MRFRRNGARIQIEHVHCSSYMLVPFLYELRSLIDWIWTESTLSINRWLLIEEIMSNTFQIKVQYMEISALVLDTFRFRSCLADTE